MTRASLEAAIAKAQDAKHDARTRKARNRHAAKVVRLCADADRLDAIAAAILTALDRYGEYMSVDLHDVNMRIRMAADIMRGVEEVL